MSATERKRKGPRPVPALQQRQFQEDLQALFDDHALSATQAATYLKVAPSTVGRWLPEKAEKGPKSQPGHPQLYDLGVLINKLLGPLLESSKEHRITTAEARKLLGDYLRMYEWPEPAIAAVTGQSEQLQRYKRALAWHDRLYDLDRAMATALAKNNRTADDIHLFLVTDALPMVVEFFFDDRHGGRGDFEHRSFRAVIYTRREDLPTELGILWAHDFRHESAARLENHYFCGDETTKEDDKTLEDDGGLVGWVFVRGKGLVINNAREHKRYLRRKRFLGMTGSESSITDDKQGRSFESLLLAVIESPNHQLKMGVLCVDSIGYKFTKHDLALVNLVAKRIGWLLHMTGTPYAAKD